MERFVLSGSDTNKRFKAPWACQKWWVVSPPKLEFLRGVKQLKWLVGGLEHFLFPFHIWDNPYKSYEISIVVDLCKRAMWWCHPTWQPRVLSLFGRVKPRWSMWGRSKVKSGWIFDENLCFLMLKTETNVDFDIYFWASPNPSSWNWWRYVLFWMVFGSSMATQSSKSIEKTFRTLT